MEGVTEMSTWSDALSGVVVVAGILALRKGTSYFGKSGRMVVVFVLIAYALFDLSARLMR